MNTVLIIDHHPIVRESLKQHLTGAFPDCVVDEAADGNAALRKIWDGSYDLVILDLSIPGRDGLFILKKIKEIHPALPVIVLSMLPVDLYGPRVIRAGASAFIQKTESEEVLLEAVRKAAAGERYISPALAEKIIFNIGLNLDPPPFEKLTDEEFQILRLLVGGKPAKEIALEMSLSPDMVHKACSRIKKQLNLKTTTELIAYALKQGLLE